MPVFKPKKKVQDPEDSAHAHDYAVFLLSLKLRTVGEVLKKMQERGYSEVVIEQTVEKLKEQRYLNDKSYAEIYLENLKMYKNFGYYGIKKKMMEKKLPVNIIESILAEGLAVGEEEKIARRFLAKEHFKVEKKSNDEEISYRTFGEEAGKERQKMAQKLKSRGFRGEVISRLLF